MGMDFNGEQPAAEIPDNLVTTDVNATENLGVLGKFRLPTDPPTAPNQVIIATNNFGPLGENLCDWGTEGAGDVIGPMSSLADEIVCYADLTGKVLGNSGVLCSQLATNPLNNSENDNTPPNFQFQKSRNGASLLQGDLVGNLTFNGFQNDAGDYILCGEILVEATEDWDTSNGSDMVFQTTENGTSTPTTAMVLSGDNRLVVNGTIQTLDGDALKPSHSFLNNDDMGLYRVNNDILGVAVAGANVMTIDGTQVKIDDELLIEEKTTFNGDLVISSAGIPDVKIVSDGSSGISLIDINNSNEYFFSIGTDLIGRYVYQNSQTGLRSNNIRGRGGTFATRAGLLEFDRISEINDVGTDSSGVQGGGSNIFSICDENWVAGAHGTKLQFKTTDKGNITPLIKLELGTDGVDCKVDLIANSGVSKINSASSTPSLEFQQGASTKWKQTGNASDFKITDVVKGIDVLTLTNFSPGQEHLRSKATQNYVEGTLELNTGVNTFKFPTTRPLDGQFLYATDGLGNLGWTSNVDHNPAYSQMYFVGNANPTTMTSQGGWFPLATTGSLNGGDWVTGPTSNFTYSTQGCNYTGTDVRTFKISMCVAWANDDVTPQVFQLGVVINGVPQTIGRMRSVLDDSAAQYPHNTSVDFIINLTNGANIIPAVTCLSANNQALVYDASFNITQVL
jgi:hypothetical protein